MKIVELPHLMGTIVHFVKVDFTLIKVIIYAIVMKKKIIFINAFFMTKQKKNALNVKKIIILGL